MKINYFLLICILLFASCENDVPFDSNDIILEITPAEQTIIANNYALAKITATVSNKTGLDKRSITFTTTSGAFTDGQTTYTTTIGTDGTASVYLKSNVLIPAEVGVKIGDYAKTVWVFFSKSYPIDLNVYTDNPNQQNTIGNKITVYIKALVDNGNVSQGLPFIFNAHDTDFNDRTFFLNQYNADADGIAKADFFLNDTSYNSTITVIGKYVVSPGDTLQDSTYIEYSH